MQARHPQRTPQPTKECSKLRTSHSTHEPAVEVQNQSTAIWKLQNNEEICGQKSSPLWMQLLK